jgi:hypothetical protein
MKQAVKLRKRSAGIRYLGHNSSTRAFAMRKVFLSAASLTVTGLMLHGAFACELNREAKPASEIVLPGGCSGSNCLVNLPQDALTTLANEKRIPVDPVQDCGAGYFDLGTYSGSNDLLEWLMASLDAQSQYKPGAGFAPSPMDANAQYR